MTGKLGVNKLRRHGLKGDVAFSVCPDKILDFSSSSDIVGKIIDFLFLRGGIGMPRQRDDAMVVNGCSHPGIRSQIVSEFMP